MSAESVQRRFQALVEHSSDGIVLVRQDGTLEYLNRAAARILGYCAEELLGRSVFELIHADDLATTRQLFLDLLDKPGASGTSVMRYRHKNGTWRWIEGTGTNRLDEAGLNAIVSSFRDITAVKQTELALLDSKTRLRLLHEQAPAILWSTNRDLIFTSGVGAGLAALGLRPGQLTGTSLFDYLGTSDPEFLPIASHLRALRGESAAYQHSWQGRVFRCRIEPLRDIEGEIIGTVGVALDITDLKRSEEALQQAHDFTRQVFSSVKKGIAVYDRSLRYVDWNRFLEELTGYSREEVLGKHPWEVFPFLSQYGFPEILQRVLAGETVTGPDIRFEFPRTGRSGWTNPTFTPHRTATGEVVGVIVSVNDITERKETQERLREYSERLQILSHQLMTAQEVERRRLARELHDEIGQMLTAINFQLHAARSLADTQTRALLDEGIVTVKSAMEQVRRLSLTLRPSMLDDLGLEAALRWFVDHEAQRHGLAIHFESNLAGRRLPSQIETACFRIAQHALTNVFRHSQAREATLTLHASRAELRMIIRDNGIGFDAAAMLRRAAEGKSFGLLGMVERAELAGGRLTIESASGRGTVIQGSFSLPVPELSGQTAKPSAMNSEAFLPHSPGGAS